MSERQRLQNAVDWNIQRRDHAARETHMTGEHWEIKEHQHNARRYQRNIDNLNQRLGALTEQSQ